MKRAEAQLGDLIDAIIKLSRLMICHSWTDRRTTDPGDESVTCICAKWLHHPSRASMSMLHHRFAHLREIIDRKKNVHKDGKEFTRQAVPLFMSSTKSGDERFYELRPRLLSSYEERSKARSPKPLEFSV